MAKSHSTNSDRSGNTIPAVAYYRMSSDRQEASIGEQREAVESFATKHGYRLLREYVDEGISGWKSSEREAFQRLIADASEGQFQAALCWSQDRFSRFPVLEANHYWYLLDKAGVHIATVCEGRLNLEDLGEWLKASVVQHGKEQYVKDIARNTCRGRLAAALRGEWVNRKPFGYIVQNKQMSVEPAEAEVVKRIFNLYLEGRSLRGIAEILNAEAIGSPSGGKWGSSTVKHILQRPVYAGIFRWNARGNGKYFTIQNGSIAEAEARGVKPEADHVWIENHHEALVDRQTFDLVQQKLGERKPKSTPFRNGGSFLFSGMLRCGKCGKAMCARSSSSGNPQYLCNGHIHSGNGYCDRNTTKQDELAEAVLSAIEARFLEPENLQRLRDELHRQAKEQASKADPSKLKRKLGTVEKKLEKAKRRLLEVDRDMLPVVQESIRELQGQKADLEAQVKAAETPHKALEAQAEELVEKAMQHVSRLRETLEQAETTNLRELLREAVDHIEVFAEKANGRYRLRRGVIHLRGDYAPNLCSIG